MHIITLLVAASVLTSQYVCCGKGLSAESPHITVNCKPVNVWEVPAPLNH